MNRIRGLFLGVCQDCARPPFALERLRELGPERLLYEVTKRVRAGAARCSSPPWGHSIGSPPWCRHRAFTATVERVIGLYDDSKLSLALRFEGAVGLDDGLCRGPCHRLCSSREARKFL